MGQADAVQPSIEDKFTAMLQSERAPEERRPAEQQQEEPPEPEEEEPAEVDAEQDDDTETEQPETDSKVEEVVKYRFKVKTEDGEQEVEMTPEEMQKSVMLERDYRRKTSEISRQREQLQEEIRKGIEEQRAQYVQNLELAQNALIKTVAPEFENVNMAKLAEEDPAQYVRLSNRMQQVQTVFQALQQEGQRIKEQQAKEHQEMLAKQVQTARETLERELPGWNDQVYQDILKTSIESYGLAPDEVNQVIDPRIIKLMHDAHQYQKLKSNKPITDKRVAQAPKVIKPTQGTSEKSDKQTQLRTQFKRSGKTEDFAELLKRTMFARK
jgi:hypothetical protein